ncbi:hypothetical protein [Noviherbaspirillum saxi]|uniref:Uncharacterized protein n=1 Tax=Noviherbaspirillum saxi TaxID=2320863 RepID=A0A3A3FSZ7_9BURK|nr:hypothetical protein [Noviherbaspirillum saxi]RJF97321.1 hypothetical protein D3871_01315 [Noviherbaspirillum saxi]
MVLPLKFIKKALPAIAALPIIFFGFLYYAFHEENSYPQAHSIDFYLKLSSVIRNVPVLDVIGTPQYFSSTGDGPKPPESTIWYTTSEKSEQSLAIKINAYLREQGFAPYTSQTLNVPIGDKKTVYQATFINRDRESLEFIISSLPMSNNLEVSVTHFN